MSIVISATLTFGLFFVSFSSPDATFVVAGQTTAGKSRPQEPRPPYPYGEEEVVYENKKDGVQLAGTLTLPRSRGPFPAVLLITGSGPQDRNEAILGHKPFLVLADHLTRLGIAVLRVDDRGVGKSTGKFHEATSEDFAVDAVAGIDYLKTRKEIDSRRIGLIGHSEGGLIASMIAARSTDVAFLVMMAGPGLTGEEILYRQGALISKAEGVSDDLIAQNLAAQKRMFKIVKEEKDNLAAETRIRELAASIREQVTKDGAEMREERKKAIHNIATGVESQAKMMVSPWFRFFLAYDPLPALMKVRCPVLAINGEKDLQVPARDNLEAIRQALQTGGNKNYEVLTLPMLNHLFQTCRTGALSEYAQIEETMSPVALETISKWILKQTGSGAGAKTDRRAPGSLDEK